MKPVRLAIAGAGGRGTMYAEFAQNHPDLAQVVAVAEPREYYRQSLVKLHHIPAQNVFTDWADMAKAGKLADAVVIATQDRMHTAPAVAFAAKGYHMLLEKPMAPTAQECRQIVQAVTQAGVIFAVGHVMRYTDYTRTLKRVLDSGAIGEIVSMQHLEPVGFWHQAHSFVRGNWRNEAESSFMLLAKSCHDLDWLRYIMGVPCLKASSFGSLRHFCKGAKPAAAGDAKRCLECAYEPHCPYSAKRIYIGRVRAGQTGWPVDILTPEPTVESVTAALATGPYGRCVYECDNDVVDNQVVNLLFEGGRTAAFTMTAFCKGAGRRTRIFGTLGEIYGDGETIELFDFLTEKTQVIDARAEVDAGHGGGDYRFSEGFLTACAANDPSLVLSGPQESLESHLMVFAAEKARRENRVVDVAEVGA